jgi:hypothetical protein
MCATHAAACLHRDGYQVFSNKEADSEAFDGSTPTWTQFSSLDEAQAACSNADECNCFTLDGTALLSGGSITGMVDSPGSCTWCKGR